MSSIVNLMKRRGRLYIFPTKMGGYFNGLIFLLFLLSIGYSSNLLLIMTLLLFGLNLLWVIQSHYHLKDLELQHLMIEDGHAEETRPFRVSWKKVPAGVVAWKLRLCCDRGDIPLMVQENQAAESVGDLSFPARGPWRWTHLYVSTERPFGLYRTWRYIKLEGRSLAYPKLARSLLTTPLLGLGAEGDVPSGEAGEGDFRDLKPYGTEEAPRISWKHYASKGELLVREGERERAPMAELEALGRDEDHLSQLATQMVVCYREGIPFSFVIDGKKRGPSTGIRHLTQCLSELALC